MREIKFRGQRINSIDWVYGSFIHNSIDCPCITDNDAEQYEVIPETIGQFTGLKDKNGVDIYEGDIIEIGMDNPAVVGWSKRFASFVLGRKGWMFSHWFGESCNPNECEVIGSIHSNPELIK